jgi:hypothetical protein
MKLLVSILVLILTLATAIPAQPGVTGWAGGNYLRRLSLVYDTYPMLISAWGYVPTAHTTVGIAAVIRDTVSINRKAHVFIDGAGAINAQVYDGAFGIATSTANAPTDAWFHMTGEFISTASRAALLAGANRGADTTSRTPAASNSFNIGQTDGNAWYATGGLAEVSIWACCASSVDADALSVKLKNGGNPLNIKNEVGQAWSNTLIAYYPLTVTTDINDASGNAHHLSTVGTLTNHASHPTIDAIGGGGGGRRPISPVVFQ